MKINSSFVRKYPLPHLRKADRLKYEMTFSKGNTYEAQNSEATFLWLSFNVINLGQGTVQDSIYEIQFILSLAINSCRANTEEVFNSSFITLSRIQRMCHMDCL